MILDGYGLREETHGNAIAMADTPVVDGLKRDYPFVKGYASGLAVGLPDGQMGNSEVGHLNMGAGRIVYQDLTKISKAIDDGDFFDNPELLRACENAKANDTAIHFYGLVSDGGVHSHQEHLYGLLELAKRQGLSKVFIHCFMDGRDTPPESGRGYVEELEKNGVVVLEDETVQITDRINLIGRKDRSVPERLSAAQLMENLDPSCYNILLDHQPHDFNNEAEAGFDLVLCGHTHGGQMFPVGITGELSGANDKTYGPEQRKDTVFIVNSGISDWAFKFKTATRSEFGVIDIQSAPEKSVKSVKSQ